MKKIIALTACMLVGVSAKADYQYNFLTLNDFTAPTNPVFDTDGTTKLDGGNGWVARIVVNTANSSAQANTVASLSVLNAGDASSQVAFLAGGGAGFISANPQTVSVASTTVTAPNTAAFYQLQVWNTADGTFAQALGKAGAKVGGSAITGTTLDGYVSGSTPGLGLPTLNTFGAFSLTTVVPEPATIALGLFGAAGMLMRRRRTAK